MEIEQRKIKDLIGQEHLIETKQNISETHISCFTAYPHTDGLFEYWEQYSVCCGGLQFAIRE